MAAPMAALLCFEALGALLCNNESSGAVLQPNMSSNRNYDGSSALEFWSSTLSFSCEARALLYVSMTLDFCTISGALHFGSRAMEASEAGDVELWCSKDRGG